MPQNRERFFIVGFKKKWNNFIFPEKKNIKVKVGDILEKKPNDKYTISSRLWSGHKRRKIQHKLKGNGFGYGLFDKESDLQILFQQDTIKMVVKFNIQRQKQKSKKIDRKNVLASRFPDSFKIPVALTSLQQFGNSVPVNVIEAISLRIIDYLKLLIKILKLLNLNYFSILSFFNHFNRTFCLLWRRLSFPVS